MADICLGHGPVLASSIPQALACGLLGEPTKMERNDFEKCKYFLPLQQQNIGVLREKLSSFLIQMKILNEKKILGDYIYTQHSSYLKVHGLMETF